MIKRDFIIGEEWLYYKIYCGQKIADLILINEINTVIGKLKADKLITKWFFMRYADPEPHLRLRLKLHDVANYGVVLNVLKDPLKRLHENNFVWTIQLDTYSRELERYGALNYEVTESFFEYDSELTVAFLSEHYQIKNDLAYLAFIYCSVTGILEIFQLSDKFQEGLLKMIYEAFSEEFKVKTYQHKRMGTFFKEQKQLISNSINKKSDLLSKNIYNLIELRNLKMKALINSVDFTNVSKFEYITSVIHMSINRLFTSRQREYEFLIYNNLYAYQKLIRYNLA